MSDKDESIKRINYFTGEFLTEQDFEAEQKYHISMLMEHNKSLHTVGIAAGLEVPEKFEDGTSVIDGTKIYVKKGMAIDGLGREIALVENKTIPVSTIIPADITIKKFDLAIYYSEKLTDPRDDNPGKLENTRITEEPVITSYDTAYSSSPETTIYPLKLATVTLHPDKRIKSIDLTVRQYASSIIANEAVKIEHLDSDLFYRLLSSTGVVEFPGFTPSVPNVSGLINPGFGPGFVSVALGLDDDKNKQIFIGTPDASEFFNLPSIQLGALVDVKTGNFRVGMSVKGDASPPIRVRWWAFKPGMEFISQIVVSVLIDPPDINLGPGKTQQFSAIVSGTDITAVTWSVKESNGGSVTNKGLYTAPTTPGTYHIVATSLADATKNGTATVTVTPDIAVSIIPISASIFAGKTQKFTATVTNAPSTEVTWSIKEGAAGGTIDNSGLYTAPSAAGTYSIISTSKDDPSKSATATVTVMPEISISVSPTQVELLTGRQQLFTASVTGSANTGVTWSVQEAGGGNVDGTGLYTAPLTAGTYHVVATSKADPSKLATAIVNVAVPVGISIQPQTATLVASAGLQFIATITGTTNTVVIWSVTEAGGGSISDKGLYTAPGIAGTYHVVVTSAADATKAAIATVIVTVPVTISVQPETASLTVNDNLQFSATVTGTTNTTVRWSVLEAGGGSISDKGLYTAPSTEGTYHVVATSAADTSKFATAIVNVTPPIKLKDIKDVKDHHPEVIVRGIPSAIKNDSVSELSKENIASDKSNLTGGRAFIRPEERPDVGTIHDPNS